MGPFSGRAGCRQQGADRKMGAVAHPGERGPQDGAASPGVHTRILLLNGATENPGMTVADGTLLRFSQKEAPARSRFKERLDHLGGYSYRGGIEIEK